MRTKIMFGCSTSVFSARTSATKEIVIDQEIARHFTVMALDYSDILCLSLEVSGAE